MVYDYNVIHNGIFYRYGENVPDDVSNSDLIYDVQDDKSSDNTNIETAPTPDVTYTRTTINRMSLQDLKTLANKQKIADVEKKSGNQLKRELIAFFNL